TAYGISNVNRRKCRHRSSPPHRPCRAPSRIQAPLTITIRKTCVTGAFEAGDRPDLFRKRPGVRNWRNWYRSAGQDLSLGTTTERDQKQEPPPPCADASHGWVRVKATPVLDLSAGR